MWTLRYKNTYVHGYCDRDTCRIPGVAREFRSLLAAKQYITRNDIHWSE